MKTEQKLEKALLKANEQDVPKILEQWMFGAAWGTEEEAYKLIRFIKIWDKFNIKMKGRDKWSAMIRSGITYRIEVHFSGLDLNRTSLTPHSLELALIGLYGPKGKSRKRAKDNRLNDQIMHDSLGLHRSKEIESVSKASKRLDLDRTTIRASRKDERYSQGVDLNTKVLKKIGGKHAF